MVDIGGGSTELVVVGGDGIESTVSTEAGSVRLTERFLESDPPRGEELAICEAHVRSLLPPLACATRSAWPGRSRPLRRSSSAARTRPRPRPDAGVCGGHLDRLAELPLERRRHIRGLASERAPVIVAGLVVLHAILAQYALGGIIVSERDLLHGVALAATELPEAEEGPAPPGAYACC